jgi:hypothetical protein
MNDKKKRKWWDRADLNRQSSITGSVVESATEALINIWNSD